MRRLAFFLLAPVVTAVGTVVAFMVLPFTPRSGRAPHVIAREWARAILRICRVRLEVVGAERFAPGEPRVFVANHTSYLDIPAALLAFPGELRVVARKSLGRIPFLGWYMRLCGHLLIDRADPRQGLELFATASKRMKAHGLSVLVFPEGTRSADGRLAPLKGGAFHLATSLDVPVQPLAISGTFGVMPRWAWGPLRGGDVVVRVGEAIPTAGRGGGPARKALATEVRAAFLALGLEDGAVASAAADEAP
jgi:1-acyl-sn-glycerol-3-phosphate acyltransferase